MNKSGRNSGGVQYKVSPFVIRVVVAMVVLGFVGGGFHLYGAINRPDLLYRLIDFGKGLPDDAASKKGVVISDKADGMQFHRFIIVEDWDFVNSPRDDVLTISAKLWVMGDDIDARSVVIDFIFPSMPVDSKPEELIVLKINQPNDINFPCYAPLTACVEYDDYIRVIVKLVDSDLITGYTSKTQLRFPGDAAGADVKLTNTVVAGDLESCPASPLQVAFGLALTEAPTGHGDWLRLHREDNQPDPAMQSHLGAIITPADQPGWGEPSLIFEMPDAPYLVYAKPYGWPCLFAFSGNANHGWYTLLPEGVDEESEEAWKYINSDSWASNYMIDPNRRKFCDLLRLGEDHEEVSNYFQGYFAFCGHTRGEATTEFAVLSWLNPQSGLDGGLRSYITKSDTHRFTWGFEPEDGEDIPYSYLIKSCSPFRNSDDRMGFVILNEEGSASLLMQPDYYTTQEILWTRSPPSFEGVSPKFRVGSFLGIVTLSNGDDGYALATDNSEILIYDDTGELVHNMRVCESFIANDIFYNNVSTANFEGYYGIYTISPRFPALVNLKSDHGNKLARLILNDKWYAGWDRLIISVWITLALIWLAALYLFIRRMKEEAFISLMEHEAAITEGRRDVEYEREKHAVSAHEIRNPLNAIKGFAKLLKDDAADEDQKESADIIIKQADRLDGILKRLLDYSRELKLRFGNVPLPEWWGELKAVAGEMAEERSVRSEWSDPPDSSAMFDPSLMQQVFINLFKNAIEASPEGETITSSLSVSRGNVVLRIEDKGAGITPEEAEKAFEKFHSSKIEGSGIGLPFSKRIVRAHDGEIYFDHSVKIGAAVVVKWPVKPSKNIIKKAMGD